MATIRDVAQRANVSIATVSNVLNAKDDRVSTDTKRRVLAAIRELKYRPTVAESSQKAMKSRTIAAVVPDMTAHLLSNHSYFREILDGIINVSFNHGWNVILTVIRTWDDSGNEIRHRFDGRCDGVILVAPQPYHDIVGLLQERGTPLVQVGSTPWLPRISCVDLDNRLAGRYIGELFVANGHKRIGYVEVDDPHISSLERLEGLRLGVGDLPVKVFRLVAGDCNRLVQELLQLPAKHRPTALLCWHDGTAQGLIAALLSAGFEVPRDFSVAGVNNDEVSEKFVVPLTTIVNPLFEIGKQAARLLLEQTESGEETVKTILLEPILLERASVGTAPQA